MSVALAAVVVFGLALGVSRPFARGVPTHGSADRHPAWNSALHVVGASLRNAGNQRVRLLGVDTTGTEDKCIQDRGMSMGPFDAAEARSIASWGSTAVRVPLNEDCWLGINGAPMAYSAGKYRSAIAKWVGELRAAGLVVILDLHWSAPGAIPATKQWPMADATHSIAFWRSVASSFRRTGGVVFDLFNEPYMGGHHPVAADWSCWLNGCTATTHHCGQRPVGASPTSVGKHSMCSTVTYRVAGMQDLVDAVRKAGADQPIMIGGLDWASTLCGPGSGSGARRCAWISYEPRDPLHQLIASFHTYRHHTHCDTRACWNRTIAALAKVVPVVTGEVGQKTCGDTFVAAYVKWADAHGVSYLLWVWQPAGKGTCGAQRLIANWRGFPNLRNPVASSLVRQLHEYGRPARAGLGSPYVPPAGGGEAGGRMRS